MKLFFLNEQQSVRRIDWWFCGAIFFLITFGLLMQYSIGVNQEISNLSSFYKQLLLILVGIGLFVALCIVDYRFIKAHPLFYFIVGTGLLVAVLLFGRELKGTTGWFIIGSISIQPVEFVKLLFILCIAMYFDKDISLMQRTKFFLISGGIAAFFIGLIILQPDLGSAFILFVIWYGYALLLKAPRFFLILIPIMMIFAVIIGWFFLFSPYQKDRLQIFIDPSSDPRGAGYHVTQSMVAIGSGSIWGRGIGLGTQSQLHFLPEVTSDFIFAAIAEELGFVGVVVLVMALSIILIRLWKYMITTKENYAFLFVVGIFIYFAAQSILVIGMNIGMLPVTGLPLPLVSAGGSSMISTLIMLGIAHRIGYS